MNDLFREINKILWINTKLNIISKYEYEKHNYLIKAGYKELNRLKYLLPKKQYSILENNFLFCAEDYPFLDQKENKITLERKEYVNEVSKKFYIHNTVFTGQQKKIINIIENNKKNTIFSLPTSAGKSFIIRKIAEERSKKYLKTIIICPSLSLMNEYHIAFSKLEIDSAVHSESNRKILVLTQERALNYEFQKKDLLIVDESYVLFEKNSRTAKLYAVIYKALKQGSSVHMFMPNITNAKNLIDNASLTKNFNFYEDFRSLSCRELNEKPINLNRKEWFEKNKNSKDKIMIFDYKQYFKNHYKYFQNNNDISKHFNEDYKILLKYLEKEFGSQFYPINLLKKGLVISNGDMPKIFRYLSELFYKKDQVNFILGTSTLSKGINFHPDRIAIFSKNLVSAKEDIDYFELRNLIGRGGRYSHDLKKRIGSFEIVGRTAKKFLFNEKVLKKISGDKIESYTKNKRDWTANAQFFSFDSKKNIDWVEDEIGVSEKKIKEIVICNKKFFEDYINFKYLNTKNENKEKNFDNIWNILINEEKIKNCLIKKNAYSLLKHDLEFKPDLSEAQENLILNTLKYQGFNESLRPRRTFIQSANSELQKLINSEKKLWFQNYILRTSKDNLGKSFQINKEIEKNISLKNQVLDALILRKSKVWSSFVEATLLPLDYLIAQFLGIDITLQNEVLRFIEEHNLPQELGRYIHQKIKPDLDISESLRKLAKTNIYIKTIKKIINE